MPEIQIARAFADLVIFLETSDDNIVDPDAAVGAMEALAQNLQLISTEAQNQLAGHFTAIAPEYGANEALVAGLPESLGLG